MEDALHTAPSLMTKEWGPVKSICLSQQGQYDMVKEPHLSSMQVPNHLETTEQNQSEANRHPDHNTNTRAHVLDATSCCTMHQLNFPG